MTLKSWLENHWLEVHETSQQQIADLLSVVDRDLKDAEVKGLSADGAMNHAYNAALQLATLALYAEGYRPGRQRAHERAINSLAYTVGSRQQTVDVLDLARRKRNTASYDRA